MASTPCTLLAGAPVSSSPGAPVLATVKKSLTGHCSGWDGVLEVWDLTIDPIAATTIGSVDIVVAGANPVNVPISASLDQDGVAAAIAGAVYPGWATSQPSANVVRFTATTSGDKPDNFTFTDNATGATATFAKNTDGGNAVTLPLYRGNSQSVTVYIDNTHTSSVTFTIEGAVNPVFTSGELLDPDASTWAIIDTVSVPAQSIGAYDLSRFCYAYRVRSQGTEAFTVYAWSVE